MVGLVDCSRIIFLSYRDEYREKKGTHNPSKSDLAPKDMLTKFWSIVIFHHFNMCI